MNIRKNIKIYPDSEVLEKMASLEFDLNKIKTAFENVFMIVQPEFGKINSLRLPLQEHLQLKIVDKLVETIVNKFEAEIQTCTFFSIDFQNYQSARNKLRENLLKIKEESTKLENIVASQDQEIKNKKININLLENEIKKTEEKLKNIQSVSIDDSILEKVEKVRKNIARFEDFRILKNLNSNNIEQIKIINNMISNNEGLNSLRELFVIDIPIFNQINLVKINLELENEKNALTNDIVKLANIQQDLNKDNSSKHNELQLKINDLNTLSQKLIEKNSGYDLRIEEKHRMIVDLQKKY